MDPKIVTEMFKQFEDINEKMTMMKQKDRRSEEEIYEPVTDFLDDKKEQEEENKK